MSKCNYWYEVKTPKQYRAISLAIQLQNSKLRQIKTLQKNSSYRQTEDEVSSIKRKTQALRLIADEEGFKSRMDEDVNETIENLLEVPEGDLMGYIPPSVSVPFKTENEDVLFPDVEEGVEESKQEPKQEEQEEQEPKQEEQEEQEPKQEEDEEASLSPISKLLLRKYENNENLKSKNLNIEQIEMYLQGLTELESNKNMTAGFKSFLNKQKKTLLNEQKLLLKKPEDDDYIRPKNAEKFSLDKMKIIASVSGVTNIQGDRRLLKTWEQAIIKQDPEAFNRDYPFMKGKIDLGSVKLKKRTKSPSKKPKTPPKLKKELSMEDELKKRLASMRPSDEDEEDTEMDESFDGNGYKKRRKSASKIDLYKGSVNAGNNNRRLKAKIEQIKMDKIRDLQNEIKKQKLKAKARKLI